MFKLYLDEDVHKRIALSLRLKGYDVISAHEVRNHGIPDYEQLEYAISEERAIFTFNAGDFKNSMKNILKQEKSIMAFFFQNRFHLVKQ